MSTIGENIQRMRKALGWTQEDLAKRMGYKSKSTINKIELGINDAKSRFEDRIAFYDDYRQVPNKAYIISISHKKGGAKPPFCVTL